MPVPADYEERVYAGVLGKIIGVYLGRPFEGWPYEAIMERLGEIWYYVHEKLGQPLIVTDDDISGTFTFLRALPDYGNRRDLTPAQIGQTWLNYIIEKRSILWWGGMGNSTEHTAYLRLKQGIIAPRSGSIALNGKTVAEQIGAQIFIDGWAMVAPGDPELAADLARRAGSVSHDGEAVYAAQVLAAMEAQAFVESDIGKLIDTGVGLIPHDSMIYRLIADLREWRAQEDDWRKTRQRLADRYGYHQFGGVCHVVPNHGVIILSLLYGDDRFQKTLMIANTCGWDTDCNSGNVGCLMGIKNGLAGIDAGPDWRGPVADRLYLPTADGGRAITDAVIETYHVVNVGRALAGLPPVAPKSGARFHFDLPGAVQGFVVEDSAEARHVARLENVTGHSRAGQRSLAVRYRHLAPGRSARVATATFRPADTTRRQAYELIACPTLYSGQTVQAAIEADPRNDGPVQARLYIRVFGPDDALVRVYGPEVILEAGSYHEFRWTIGDTGGAPIGEIGLELNPVAGVHSGSVYLDYLTWGGAPNIVLTRPASGGLIWHHAWVPGMDHFDAHWPWPFHVAQDEGTGLLIQGAREWTDYQVSATLTPHLSAAVGLGIRVQGMRRYYALLLRAGGTAALVKALDGETMLAEAPFAWSFDQSYTLRLQAVGARLQGWIDDRLLFDVEDANCPLDGGGAALILQEGCLTANAVVIRPAS
jgi:ADP-ribosylglycohydrolase